MTNRALLLDEIEVLVMGNPPPGFGGRYFTFVKLTTKCGIVGWGEVYAASVGPVAMQAVIEDVFERHCFQRAANDIELMFRSAYSAGFTQRPDLTVMGAFSGIEMACWDILGKAHDVPIYKLLGGQVYERIRAYTYLYPHANTDAAAFYNSPELSAARAVELVELGFTALKFDPAGAYTVHGGRQPSMVDIEQSAAFCREIRAAVGTDADLLFGTHGQFTTSGAIRLSEAIAPYAPLWYEEPCPPDNLLEYQKVVQASPIPIAAGERLTTKYEFATLLRTGGAAILQPALGRVGGIWEAKKIAGMAEAFNAQLAPHLYAGPIEWLANLHLASSCPNFLIAETILTMEGIHGDLLLGEIEFDAGYFRLSDEPGLGAELNEELVRAHPYTGDKLHLEMQVEPYNYGGENKFAGGGD